MTKDELLQKVATQLRIDVLEMLIEAGSGHAAGPLSSADIMTFLYFEKLKHDPKNPDWKARDYFLVSNGHICPIWYAALARSGYFPASELKTLRKFGSILQGHPWNLKTPGVFNSSGPLGHGSGQAIGVAIGLKLDKQPNHVYCLLSDGEHDEGATWEAIMSAPKFKLNNLTFIVDRNNIQIDGTTDQIMSLDGVGNATLSDKYKSFGWNVLTVNGHSFEELRTAFAQKFDNTNPTVIIANTIAGKGVSEMENNPKYHDWRGDIEMAKRGITELRGKLTAPTNE